MPAKYRLYMLLLCFVQLYLLGYVSVVKQFGKLSDYREIEPNDTPEQATAIPSGTSPYCNTCRMGEDTFCRTVIGKIGAYPEDEELDGVDWFKFYINPKVNNSMIIEFSAGGRFENINFPILSIINADTMQTIRSSTEEEASEAASPDYSCGGDNRIYWCDFKYINEPEGWYYFKIEICKDEFLACISGELIFYEFEPATKQNPMGQEDGSLCSCEREECEW